MSQNSSDLLKACGLDFSLLSQSVFDHFACTILEIYEGNRDDHGLSLASACGVGWVDIPRLQTPTLTTLLAQIAKSSDYESALRNQAFPHFDKRSLVFVCNKFSPQYPECDSWTVKQIITKPVGDAWTISDVIFTLHDYGDYCLPALCCSRLSTSSLYEAYSAMAECFMMDLKISGWSLPSEKTILTALAGLHFPTTLPELKAYCAELGFI